MDDDTTRKITRELRRQHPTHRFTETKRFDALELEPQERETWHVSTPRAPNNSQTRRNP